MTSKPGKKTFVIHILSNISRIKGNKTMKFEQLLDYNMRNIFLEKSYIKGRGETLPRPFSKKSQLRISLDQGILYVHGWCVSFKILYFFLKTLMTLL